MHGETLIEQLDGDELSSVIACVNSGGLDNDPAVIELRREFVADELASSPDHIHYPTDVRQRIAIRGISKATSVR